MSFNMIFILANKKKTTLLQIARGLKQTDAKYRFESEEYFLYGSELLGQIDIWRPEEKYFQDWIQAARDRARTRIATHEAQVAEILRVFDRATGILFFNVLWEDRERVETIELYQPLWEWLFEHREGLLYVDSEGYWNVDELLLPDKLS